MRRILFLLGACAFLFTPAMVAAAQFTGLPDVSEPLAVSIEPENLVPYGQAMVSVSSAEIDLSRATLVVSANGVEVYRGNVKPVQIPLGAGGSSVSVRIAITTLAGRSYNKTISLRPQDVLIIIEPVSSVPPLYPGKSLVPIEGDARVVAVANLLDSKGRAIDPARCSYVWTVDGAQISGASGVGKSSILVASPLQYRSRSVSVSITGPDGSYEGGASAALTVSEPTIRIYEKDPLLGILYENALSKNYKITGAEKTFFAAPFSFPLSAGGPSLEWFVNGVSSEDGPTITLRPTGEGAGRASLSLVGSMGSAVRAATGITLLFGNNPSGSLFGL